MRDETIRLRLATEGDLLHSGHTHLTKARRPEHRRTTDGHVQLMLSWMVMGDPLHRQVDRIHHFPPTAT